MRVRLTYNSPEMDLRIELDTLNKQLVAAYDLQATALPGGASLDEMSQAIAMVPGSEDACRRLMGALGDMHDLYGRATRGDHAALQELRARIAEATAAITLIVERIR